MSHWNCPNYGHTYNSVEPRHCIWCGSPPPPKEDK